MVLSDTVPQLAQAFLGITITRTQALLGVTSFALLPLFLLEGLSKLAPFSLVGIIGMAYTVAAMAMFCSLAASMLKLQNEVPWAAAAAAAATGLTGLAMGIIGTMQAIKSMQAA
jgi:preprotein translocase subunit SecF